jgi:hypothetical protein
MWKPNERASHRRPCVGGGVTDPAREYGDHLSPPFLALPHAACGGVRESEKYEMVGLGDILAFQSCSHRHEAGGELHLQLS